MSTVSNDIAHSSCLKPVALPVWLAASSCCKRYSLTSYGDIDRDEKCLLSNNHSTRRTIGFMHQLITRSDTSVPADYYACRLWCPLPCHKWVWLKWHLSTLGWRWTPASITAMSSYTADASSNQTCRRTLFIHKTICCLRRNWSFFVLWFPKVR